MERIVPGDTVRMSNSTYAHEWDEDDETIMYFVIGVQLKRVRAPRHMSAFMRPFVDRDIEFMQATLLAMNRAVPVCTHPVDRLVKLF